MNGSMKMHKYMNMYGMLYTYVNIFTHLYTDYNYILHMLYICYIQLAYMIHMYI